MKPDPEKVIKGLEEIRDCESIVYKHRIDAVEDAITLLKAQEPRVMSYAELEDTMGDRPVWYEAFLTEIPCLAIVCSKSSMENAYAIFDFNSDKRHLCTEKTYGDVWRCWTSRPTDEQREATPWE